MNTEINIDYSLKVIADTFLECGVQVEDLGLISGKMGISIFLFHYSRYTGISLYKDYAVKLIEEIQKQIPDHRQYNYGQGLA